MRVESDRIDAAIAIQFKDMFRDMAATVDGPVVLDLAQVTFLDSSGLGAVVAARKLLGADRALELAGLNPAVEKVMQLTRMNTVFLIHDTRDAALAAHGVAPAA
tara:strand:+ start:660 stop:971 length:312 start_codon:yes stop_codon:yes gene_type:complete